MKNSIYNICTEHLYSTGEVNVRVRNPSELHTCMYHIVLHYTSEGSYKGMQVRNLDCTPASQVLEQDVQSDQVPHAPEGDLCKEILIIRQVQ